MLGAVALRTTPLRISARLERWLFQIGLGLGLLTGLPLLLSLFGLLNAMAVRIALGSVGLLAAVTWGSVRVKPVLSTPDSEPQRDRLPRWGLLLAALMALFLLAILVVCLLPMMDYDGLAYHVYAPRRWLQLGSLRMLPTLINTEWPMGQEMLYLLLLPLGGADACKPLVAFEAALTVAAIVALGSRVHSRAAGMVAAALFLYGAGLPGINTTSVEVALTLFTTLSALALTCAAQAEAKERFVWLLFAALMAGFGCCVKLNGLIVAVYLAIAASAISSSSPGGPGKAIRNGALFLLISTACALPWYRRAWIDTGNPIYPFAYGLLGGRVWSHQAASLLTAYFRYFGLPGESLAARHAVWVRQMLKMSALFLFLLILPAPRWVRGFVLLAGGFSLMQLGLSYQLRFALPAAPFLGMAAGYWVARFAGRHAWIGWSVTGILALLCLPSALRAAAESLPTAFGPRPRSATLQALNFRPACLWANRHLPAQARIIMEPDGRGYYLDREVWWASSLLQQNVRYDTLEVCMAGLHRNGITHLMINRHLYLNPQLQFEMKVGWRDEERLRLNQVASQSKLIYKDPNISIYSIK